MTDMPMNKQGLTTLRADLIKAVETATNTKDRTDAQLKLSTVNAEIKRLNIIASAESKHNADIKRALGQHENAANERRREIMEARPGTERDEGVLIRAKQLLRDMERHPTAPAHFASLLEPLKGFIEAQKAHLRKPSEPAIPSEDAKWRETWQEGKDAV